ncbi:hypothetical protein ACTXT7_011218 [Hymenolepis weldensis]
MPTSPKDDKHGRQHNPHKVTCAQKKLGSYLSLLRAGSYQQQRQFTKRIQEGKKEMRERGDKRDAYESANDKNVSALLLLHNQVEKVYMFPFQIWSVSLEKSIKICAAVAVDDGKADGSLLFNNFE